MSSARQIGEPEPGYYKRRLVKGGPMVGVRFFVENHDLMVEVDGRTHFSDGRRIDPYDEWPLCWPSSEAEFNFFARVRDWAITHGVDHPAARPRAPIDLHSMPSRIRR